AGYVVKGALYTTYTMWHIIYGPMKREIMRLTEEVMSPALLSRILASPDRTDKYWALARLGSLDTLSPALVDSLLADIEADRYNLAARTISALTPRHLMNKTLQAGLLEKFREEP